jgi:hypothetical protein
MTVAHQQPTRARTLPQHVVARNELERRLEQVLTQLEAARHRLREGRHAMRAAEEALLLRRQECEQAAELVAELATLAESLERGLSGRA